MIWKTNKQSVSAGDDSLILQAGRDIIFNADFPIELVDQKIDQELNLLRKSRFFGEFDLVGSSCVFGRRLLEGDLSKGTDAVRGPALAWCARLLSRTDKLCKAEEYLAFAKSLGVCPEIMIAEAFVSSAKGDKTSALEILVCVNSSMSRSAAFMISTNHEGIEGAINWFRKSGLGLDDLDSDGKASLITNLLNLGRWEAARESLDKIDDQDLIETPTIHHLLIGDDTPPMHCANRSSHYCA